MLQPDKFRKLKNEKLKKQFDDLAYAHFEACQTRIKTERTHEDIEYLTQSTKEQLAALRQTIETWELEPRPAKAAKSHAGAFPDDWPWRGRLRD